MEDKNNQVGGFSPSDATVQSPSSVGLSGNVGFDPQALSADPVASAPLMQSMAAQSRGSKIWLRWATLLAAALVLVGAVAYILIAGNRDKGALGGNASGRFETTVVPLDNIHVEPIVNLSNTKLVTINGSLTVKEGLIVAPTVQPADAQAGQIYYDINSNTLAYFNGTSFVSVGGTVVNDINNLTGRIPLGAGLADVNGQIVNTGVLSVQGQTGDVALTAGSGITINGTNITNNGVITLTSNSPTLVVSDDGSGNFSLSLAGGGTGTVTSLGGTPGRIAKFTTAQNIEDSLLSESGGMVTVGGNLTVNGSVTLTSPLTVANGGTGAASLGANGVLVGNGTGSITSVVSGVAGMCLVSTAGAPTWATCNPPSTSVNSLNGLTGTLTIANATGLVDTITIDDASTSNKGIAQFNGTNFSVTGGNVNTVQNISTTSSPTFNSLTLSGNLTVQGGTSTLGTLTQAGSLVIHDGSSNTVTIVAANLSADRIYTLPDAGGDATLCVTAGNCIGGSGSAPNGADYLVANLNGTLTNERALTNGSNITLTDGGANGNFTVATVQNPTFTTSVTTPALQSSGALVLTSAAGNTVAIDAATTIELQDSTNVTGTLDVSVALNVGTADAFAVNSSGVITAAAGITSSGTIVFSGLNCTGNANGGALTTNGSGQLICSDDDGGSGGTLTGSGTSGTIPVFNGATSITNSIITQSGTTITVAGDLVLNTDLTVANGGTGTSSFTSNGVLYGNGSGALQVTAAGTGGQVLIANASGVPTFATFSGDVTVSNTGVTTIQANSVALGTDTTGDYVSSLGTLTGLSTSGNAGEGSTPTLSVTYGSIANTAVQGNVTLTCPSGTGNLTGGGTSITLGTGGSCGNLSTVNNPTFSTSVTTPNLILTGAGSNGTIVVGNLGQGTVYTLPDPGQATADICLSVGNCATAGAAGGDLTGTYPNPTIAKLQGTNLNISSPLAGHILIYNGTNSAWENHAISSDIAISETGVATIQSNAVALGNDTTGDYVIGLTAGNGVSVTGTSGEGWSPTVAVLYGSTANTAVQGNTSITVSAGTNLTGGGSITLGAGGSVTLDVANSPTFSGNLTVQGGTTTVGTATQQGVVVLHDGSSNTGTLQTAALGQNTVYTLPDPGGASVSICLTTGNCAGSGGGVTTSGGTTNNLAKFTGSQTIGDSLITDDGSTVTITGSGNFVVQGGTSTLGTTTQAGTLSISDGSSNTVSIVATGVAANRTYTLPDAGGAADFCLSSGNCVGGSGGAPNAADYLVLNLNGTLSNERALTAGSNISFTDGGANSTLTVATVQNPTFTTSVTTPTLQSSGALVISSGSGTVSVDATTTIELQDSTNVTGSLDVSAALNVGTLNAFAVSSAGVITAATGITSSGTITFSGLNCTTFANGGSVTTNASGVLSCSDDDGAAANTITGTGTSGTVALFNGANTITDSIITQTGGNTIAIAGTLNLTNDLTVANGGTGASSFTSNGVLYGNGSGAIQVTAAGTGGQVLIANATGVPTFATFSGDVAVSNTGVTTIQANSVALGTDTTGDYVANIGTLTGLSTTGNSGEGSTPTLSVLYGSGANTAVQGSTTLTCPSGTGNLSGGGTSITLGAGGSCGNISIVNNPTFTTSVTTPDLILTGAGSNGSLVVASLGQGTTYTLPDPGQATASICLSTGNCTAVGTAGGDLTGSYPSPTIAKLQGGTLNISTPTGGHVLIYNSTNSAWENHAVSGDVAISETGVATIQANSVALGTDTAGDYVANLGSLTGLSTTGNSGEGSTPTLSVLYGSTANTAVQGSTTLTCPSGTGNLSGGGTSITLGAGGTCGNITITNSPTFTGTLTVNTITPTSAMTVGSTSQTLTLQGNATTTLTATDSGFTTTIGFTTPTANTTLNFPALAAGTYNICTSSGNCAGAGVTLQAAYNNSATPEITLDATRAALTIRDNSTPLVGNLLEVQNNNGSTTYFAVDNAGISTTGTNTSSGDVNTTGGAIQTNSTNRIDNSGNLLNIGNLTATGAITVTSTGATNDIVLNSADTIELQDATNVTGAFSATSTITLGALGTADTSTYVCRNSSNQLAACNTSGAGTAFIQGGNTFAATATLGTNDANGLDIRTNSTTRLSIGSGGGILVQGNATADELEVGDDIFNLNDANSRINLGSSANDSYIRMGESSLLFGFLGWQNSINTMRLATFGANDVRLETNSTARITVSGAGVTSIAGVGSSGVAGFNVDTTQNSATGLQPGNILNATLNPGGAASGSYFGNQLTVGIGAAGTTFTGDIIANLGQVNWSGASNTSNTGKVYGTVGKVVTSAGAGTIQNAVGLFSQLQYASTVTNSYNVYASNLQSGSTTNLYGFYAEQMTGGTNNYPLYLASGTANQPLLSVNGTGATTFANSANSTSAFQIQNALGVSGLNVDTTTTNVITNPSFEANTTGWTAKGAATLSRVTTQYLDNNASMQIATTAASGDGAKYAYALASSTQYSLSFNIKTDSGGFNIFEIGYSNDGSTDVSCSTNIFGETAKWSHNTCTFTTGATSGSPYIYVKQINGTARNIYIDAVSLEAGGSVSQYRNVKVSLSGNLAINAGQSAASSTLSTLYVQSNGGGDGVVITGNSDANVLENALKVRTADGTDIFWVNEAGRGATIQGGSSFFNTAAFQAISTNSAARALDVKGASGQTADILNVKDSSSNILFSVGATGAVLSKNTTNSTTAFQVQNANGNNLLSADTTNTTVSVSSAGAAAYYGAKTDSTVGTTAKGVATGDFDKDGDLDYVVTNSGSGNANILLNNGSGVFSAGATLTTGTTPRGVVTGDFDKDGDIDIAVVNNGSNTLSIFLNTGTGTFAAPATPSTGASTTPVGIVMGDFDKDGDPDLAVSAPGTDVVVIMTNNGSGTFAVGSSPSVGAGCDPGSIVAGDVDKDGDIDLITGCTSFSTIHKLTNNGSGTFTDSSLSGSVGNYPTDMALADTDKDGDLDLVVANSTTSTVTIISNTGTGSFPTPPSLSYTTGTTPQAVAVADLDKDGDPDIIVTNSASNTVSYLINLGNNLFVPKVDLTTGTTPWAVATGDVDKDGAPDIVVTNSGTTTASVFLSNILAVSPTASPTLTLYTGGINDAFTVKNADGTQQLRIDARGNLVLGSSTTTYYSEDSSVNITNSGLFADKALYSLPTSSEDTTSGDFNKDGYMDVAVSGGATNMFSVFLGNGDGTFGTRADYTNGSVTGFHITSGDFDKDGDLDIAVTNRAASTMSIFLNDGSGVFTFSSNPATGTNPEGIVATDIDKDGDLDLVTANGGAGVNTVSVFTNNGSGTFTLASSPAAGTSPEGITAGDFDKDGDPDLAVVDSGGTALQILTNNGSGTFSTGSALTTGGTPLYVTAGDFDKDGDLDLAVSNWGGLSRSVSVFINNGSGSFAAKVDYPVGIDPAGITSADFNQDGNLDIAVNNYSSTSISILAGVGNGTFAAKADAAFDDWAYGGVAAADFDRDGDLDLAAGTEHGYMAVIFNTTLNKSRFKILSGDGSLTNFEVNDRGVYVGSMSADSTGALLVLDTKNTTGDPTGVNGAMYYNSAYGRFRCYQNGVWVDCIGGGSREYMRGEMRTVQNTAGQVDAGDHVKFANVDASAGGSVSLDTTSSYVDSASTAASVGRITLAAGKTYRLTSNIPYVTCTAASTNCEVNFSWYNVTGNAQLGSTGIVAGLKMSADDGREGNAEAIFTPSVTSVVELRIVVENSLTGIGYTTSPQLLYPSFFIEVLSDGGAGGASAAEYLRAELGTDQSTNLASNDHIKFDQIQASSGSSITLDTTTAYTSGAGASIGRFTLAAGKTYKLDASIPRVVFGSSNSSMQYWWYNVTTGSMTGTMGGAISTTWASSDIANDPNAETVISPSVTTVVELRLGVSGSMSLIGDGGSGRMPSAFIEVLSDGTKIAQFQGATSLVDGQAGYVPMPTAGQQGSFLLGDGTWSTGVKMINSATQLGINDTKLFNATVNQGSDATTRYYQLGQFGSNNGEFKIEGILAGHTKTDGKGNVDIKLSARDGFMATGTAFGLINKSDILVYYDGVSTYTVWLKTGQWALANIDVTTITASATWDGTYQTTTPSGTLTYTLSTDTSNVMKMDNNGGITLQTSTNTTGAFSVKNAAGNNVISIDTSGGNQNNLITNPSFETNTTGWAAKGVAPTAISRTTSQQYSGSAALQIYANASGDGAKYNVTLADSTNYSVSYFAKLDASVDDAFHSSLAAGYASDGSTETNATCKVSYIGAITSSHWGNVKCTFTTPASHSGTPYFYIKGTDTGYTYYVDAVLLQTDANADSNYREGKISLQGTVVSPLIVQNSTDGDSAFAVQNSYGSDIISVSNSYYGTYNESGVLNSDFEQNTTGWSAVGTGTTIIRATNTAWSGRSSLKVSTGTVAGSGAKYVTGLRGAYWSDDARITFFVRASTGTITDITAAYSWDGNSASEASDTCSSPPTSVTTTWREVDCWIGNVGAGVPTANAYIIIKQTGTTAQTFYIDAVAWEQDYGDPGPVTYGSGTIMLGGVVVSPAMFRNQTNSDMALAVQGSEGNSVLRIDTANRRIYVGDPNTTSYSTVLILDSYNGSGQAPSAISGAIYYDSTRGSFRCYTSSRWDDCAGTRSMVDRRWGYVNMTTTTATALTGVGASTRTTSGTASNGKNTESSYVNFTNAGSGTDGGVLGPFTDTERRYSPIMTARIRTDGTAMTTTRYWVGLFESTPMGFDPPTTSVAQTVDYIGIGYSAGVNSGKWLCASGDGTNTTGTDTGVTVTANHYYDIIIDLSTSSLICSISDNGGAWVSVTKGTGNLPGTAVDLGMVAATRSTGAVTRAAGISYLYFDHN